MMRKFRRRRSAAQPRPIPHHPDYVPDFAFWMADDEELNAMIERMAVSSQATRPMMGYLLAEYDRRAQRKTNDELVNSTKQMAELTEKVVEGNELMLRSANATTRLTWTLVGLTVVLIAMTAVMIF